MLLNRITVFDETGVLFDHTKTHIFPVEGGDNTREGDAADVSVHNGIIFGVAICYEIEISEFVTMLIQQGAQVIFCPCNGYISHCRDGRSI